MDPISVSQISQFIRKVLGAQEVLHHVCVYGEISGFKFSGQHAYFTLKDADAAIQCTCFNARRTYTPTKEGEAVLVVGAVDYYVKSGRLSLMVSTIQPVGQGKLHVLLEQLKAKLKEEGLFDPAHKKPIPPYPKRVCVLTSKTGAVIRDIVRTVRLVNDVLDIDVVDVRVQGDSAAADIVRQLAWVDTLGYDCVILARGGGSFEDLMPFNDEGLARAIYAMQTPIISAIGHETDFSISDFVADSRAATPTAAASMVAYDVADTKARILDSMNRALRVLTDRQTLRHSRCAQLISALSDRTMRKLDRAQNAVGSVLSRLEVGLDNLLSAKEKRVDAALTKLDAVNPVRLLQNGYSRIISQGRTLPYDSIAIGDRIEVVTYLGRLQCLVEDKQDDPFANGNR